MSRWGPYVKQRLDDLECGKGRDLWEGDWPAVATVRAAWRIACDTFPEDALAPSVVPTEEGWVAFVWRGGGYDIELEVGDSENADVWIHKRSEGGSGKTLPLAEAQDELKALLLDLGRHP